VVLAIVFAAVPGAARAAGFWNLEWGAANYARGGADTAAPRDPSAIMRNPAALAGHKGLALMIDANLVRDQRDFIRAPDDLQGFGNETTYDEVKNDNALDVSPSFFVAYNLGELAPLPLTLGAGVWGVAPRSDVVFPQDGPQRYSLIESHNLQIHYGVAVAAALPWFGLKVGVTGMMVSQLVRQSLMLDAFPSDSPGQGNNDVLVEVDARDDYIPSAIVAVSSTPSAWVTVAASYQLAWNAEATGTADVTMVGEVLKDDAVVEGDEVLVKLRLPAVARLAAQLHEPGGSFDLELALVWEQWSRNDTIDFEPQDIRFRYGSIVDRELDPVIIESGFRDTLSARLGGQVQLVPELLTVRAGGYWERGAVPPERLAPGSFDLNKIGIAAGGRLDIPYGLWVDLAFGMAFWSRTNVDNSEVTLTDPLTGEAAYPIGNGSYGNTQTFVMAAIGARLDI
jgi:long-subunit fatty acid transport protein